MQAIEFHATIKNGTIEIPQDYRGKITGDVRVILVSDEPVDAQGDFIQELLEHPVPVDGFRPLTRDEIYGE